MTRSSALSWLFVMGCATSSVGNYSVTYATVGPVNETGPANAASKTAFDRPATAEEQRALASVQVFMDTVPPELSLRDNVISIAAESNATLVGSVEVAAIWKAPSDDAAALPTLQRAAQAAGANVAFCPRNQQALGRWKCHLVKRPAVAAPPVR